MSNSVKFHDKEIPILQDFTNIGVYSDDAIKEVLSKVVTSEDIVVKGLAVTQTAPASMGVLVSPDGTAGYGMALRSDGDIINIISPNTVSINNNSSGQSRIDIIIAKEDYQDNTQENRYFRTSSTGLSQQLVYIENKRIATMTAVDGTPGTGVAPAMSGYPGYIKLAEVTVANGAASIVNANIKDVTNSSTWTTDTSSVNRYDSLTLKEFKDAYNLYVNQDVRTSASPTFVNLNLSTGLIRPTSDSTSSLKIQNAAGTQTIITIDSTNQYVGINTAKTTGDPLPKQSLDVYGHLITRGNISNNFVYAHALWAYTDYVNGSYGGMTIHDIYGCDQWGSVVHRGGIGIGASGTAENGTSSLYFSATGLTKSGGVISGSQMRLSEGGLLYLSQAMYITMPGSEGTALFLGGSAGDGGGGVLTINPTWNTAQSPTAILTQINYATAGAGAKLLDLQRSTTSGGAQVSRFSVDMNGSILSTGNSDIDGVSESERHISRSSGNEGSYRGPYAMTPHIYTGGGGSISPSYGTIYMKFIDYSIGQGQTPAVLDASACNKVVWISLYVSNTTTPNLSNYRWVGTWQPTSGLGATLVPFVDETGTQSQTLSLGQSNNGSVYVSNSGAGVSRITGIVYYSFE